MSCFVRVMWLVAIVLVSGCSSESAKRTAYETIQNIRQRDCVKEKDLSSDCGKREDYEDYQRKRKELDPSE